MNSPFTEEALLLGAPRLAQNLRISHKHYRCQNQLFARQFWSTHYATKENPNPEPAGHEFILIVLIEHFYDLYD